MMKIIHSTLLILLEWNGEIVHVEFIKKMLFVWIDSSVCEFMALLFLSIFYPGDKMPSTYSVYLFLLILLFIQTKWIEISLSFILLFISIQIKTIKNPTRPNPIII